MVLLASRTRFLLLGLWCVCCCGASPDRQDAAEFPKATILVWPQPPQPARVRFVQAVSGPRDLGVRKSVLRRFIDAFAGADRMESFVRPTGVATAENFLYIADPGSSSLWIFNIAARQGLRISKAAKQALVSPVAVAAAEAGTVYLADSYLAKVFLYDAKGHLKRTITTQGMQRPAGVAYNTALGRLYVADSAAHRVWMFTGDGQPIGSLGKRGTGPGEFNFPTHLALGEEGVVFVTDALGFRVQCFTAEGNFVQAFGRHGDAAGDFASPKGIALDSEGHVYVVDALFDTVQIFDSTGRYLLSFGGQGAQPGEFWLPNGIAIGAADRIYVADAYNRRIQVFDYVAHPNDS
jgi:sugar lactone lactonase YvrE